MGLTLKTILFQSACVSCSLLYGVNAHSKVPSLSQLASQKNDTGYYDAKAPLLAVSRELLLQKFIVGFLYTLDQRALEKAVSGNLISACPEVEVKKIESNMIDRIIEFVDSNYYSQFPDHYNHQMRKEFRDAARTYFSGEFQGVVYLKNGVIVGCLFTNEYHPHPGLKESSLHIGYWGYNRNEISQEQARWIRQDWIVQLKLWSHGELQIDASIDCFNTSALKLVEKLGFQFRMVRLDRKVSC